MKTVLGVDPGTGKCGLAVVRTDGEKTEILARDICDVSGVGLRAHELVQAHNVQLAVVGNGTNSKAVQVALRESSPGLSLLIVDERDSSIRARERYWECTPRRGWRRLLPSSLQVPPVPIDDYVAVILAERAISAH
ncbi:MAG: pre-16S rRNA-processing nuclease YqgF [Armatimonadetes bacterium]|nr:MAG: pre-16S rRNA-processing nuclease YqgF [Armatimonadota bacterium]MCE7899332.1 pre-16S rRNA-processing nuclease YqgF [Armatimonadetes bacterium ATM1]MDL1927906.1 pre-16S rRNA-processing nuclease YqgF [Fimbriimonadia bacterium ATM]MBC6969330.1 pre-16S rRNA-processing nuclease YqgF [Armatimonadota bacterium]MBL1149488.1 pre-16S rRNA-processing nuclease YqgF [Armatimonadota bacterium]